MWGVVLVVMAQASAHRTHRFNKFIRHINLVATGNLW